MRRWLSLFAFENKTVTLCFWEYNSHSAFNSVTCTLCFWEYKRSWYCFWEYDSHSLLLRIRLSLFAFENMTVTLYFWEYDIHSCFWECDSHSLLLRKQHSLSFWECDHDILLLRIQQSLFTLFFLSLPPPPPPPLCLLIFFLLNFNTGSGVLFCMAQLPVTETMNLCYENKWKHWNSLLCCANWQSSNLFILLYIYICITLEDIPLVEFIYTVFTRMPGKNYRRWLRSLLLSLCNVFRAQLTPLNVVSLPACQGAFLHPKTCVHN